MRSPCARDERTLIAMKLDAFGWDDGWAAASGRVVRVDFVRATVVTEHVSVRAVPGDTSVTVGDWVVLDGERVVDVLPRRSSFVRGDPMDGTARGAQVVAANIDTVLVVQALVPGVNQRRLERELVLAFESGAEPVVVLTNADLVAESDVVDAADRAGAAAPDIEVVVTSVPTDRGFERLHELARPHRTLALIGASGVGKSSIVNHLVGAEVQDTGAVRANDKRGRHTTTARELVLIPGGGVLIDTPGLRAVSLWVADEGMSRAFADVEALAAQCRFSNCSHTLEPGCAIRAAMERGELEPARFEHYLRLNNELDDAERRRAKNAR